MVRIVGLAPHRQRGTEMKKRALVHLTVVIATSEIPIYGAERRMSRSYARHENRTRFIVRRRRSRRKLRVLATSNGPELDVRRDFFGDLDIANAVALQPDGKVGVAGSVRNGANTLLGLIRVLP